MHICMTHDRDANVQVYFEIYLLTRISHTLHFDLHSRFLMVLSYHSSLHPIFYYPVNISLSLSDSWMIHRQGDPSA